MYFIIFIIIILLYKLFIMQSIIRKNIITNEWEHFISEEGGRLSYWAQGIIGNDNYKITNKVTDIPKYSDKGDLLLYQSVESELETYSLQLKTYIPISNIQNKEIVDINKQYRQVNR